MRQSPVSASCRLIGLALATIVLSLVGIQPVAADKKVEAVAEELGQERPGGSGGGGGPVCTYTPVAWVNPGESGTSWDWGSAEDANESAPGSVEMGVANGDGTFGIGATSEAMQYRYTNRDCDGTITQVWALIATPANLAEGAFDRVKKLVPEPVGTFTPTDLNEGWLYVQVPTDFRIPAWAPIPAEARAGSVWASATATPRVLRFDPGDPLNPGVVECSGSATTTAVDPAVPGSCSYTYLNSSSVTGSDRFDIRFTLVWDVTFQSSAGIPRPPEVIETDYVNSIAVAEARPSS